MDGISWGHVVIAFASSIVSSITIGIMMFIITRKFNKTKAQELQDKTDQALLVREIKCLVGALMKMNGWGEKFYAEYLKQWKNYANKKSHRDIIEEEVKDDLNI